MMIVVANLQNSGFVALVAERVERALSPVVLLISIVTVAGFFSAFSPGRCGETRYRICWR
jgi:hypothetical protein